MKRWTLDKSPLAGSAPFTQAGHSTMKLPLARLGEAVLVERLAPHGLVPKRLLL
jgi:hypothetical protein